MEVIRIMDDLSTHSVNRARDTAHIPKLAKPAILAVPVSPLIHVGNHHQHHGWEATNTVADSSRRYVPSCFRRLVSLFH